MLINGKYFEPIERTEPLEHLLGMGAKKNRRILTYSGLIFF